MGVVTAPSPLRTEAGLLIQAEIARVGAAALDRSAIARMFVAKGAARSRVYVWIKEEIELAANPPDPDLSADLNRAEAAFLAEAAERAEAAARAAPTLPTGKQIRAIEQQARRDRATESTPAPIESPVPDSPPPGSGVTVSAAPIMARLERAIAVVEQCIDHSFGADGRMRNPRMALAAADSLRRCLETALRLQEAVDNIQTLQRFMDELMGGLRDVAPEVASAVVERLREVNARWAR